MKKLAIIPARGGSKRIPRKNIRNFCGKPIIAYSIEAAFAAELFDEVMVSTDDSEIAEVAMKYGAKVPFARSDENADDFATTADVIQEVLQAYASLGMVFDYVCCIYATAPFITGETLNAGFNKLLEENRSTVFPVVEFSYPIWRGLKKGKSDSIEMIWPEHLKSRSQDLEPTYHDAGQWYWLSAHNFFKDKEIYSQNCGCLDLKPLMVQDIDSEFDWQLAELKFKLIYDA